MRIPTCFMVDSEMYVDDPDVVTISRHFSVSPVIGDVVVLFNRQQGRLDEVYVVEAVSELPRYWAVQVVTMPTFSQG